MLPSVGHANTQIQIHKYTNTALARVEHIQNMCYIFEKVMLRGPQKQCSRVCDKQIPKYRYTNTQIELHKYTNTVWVKFADRPIYRPNMCYIFEKVMVMGKAQKFQYGECRIRPVYSVYFW